MEGRRRHSNDCGEEQSQQQQEEHEDDDDGSKSRTKKTTAARMMMMMMMLMMMTLLFTFGPRATHERLRSREVLPLRPAFSHTHRDRGWQWQLRSCSRTERRSLL